MDKTPIGKECSLGFLLVCFSISVADEFLRLHVLKPANQTALWSMLSKETNNACNIIGSFEEYTNYQTCEKSLTTIIRGKENLTFLLTLNKIF